MCSADLCLRSTGSQNPLAALPLAEEIHPRESQRSFGDRKDVYALCLPSERGRKSAWSALKCLLRAAANIYSKRRVASTRSISSAGSSRLDERAGAFSLGFDES